MKSVRGRHKKRVDYTKLRDFTPIALDKKLVDTVKRKVGLEGIAKILESNQGASNISKLLANKVNVKEVSSIKKMLDEDSIDVKGKLARFKFFFPYRGVWFFDIIMNRKLGEKPEEDELCKYIGVFLNGNSGYVRAYEMINKSQAHITEIFNQFIQDNREDDYPVKKIISDNESGVPTSLGNIEIVKKTQTGTSHGTLSRINSFASKLRDFHHKNNKTNKEYITLDELDTFITIWNNYKVPVVNCSRTAMMEDVDLEEAYIAVCMTENADVKKAVEESFKADDLVKVRETNDKYNNNVREKNQEKTSTYRVVENKDGSLILENVDDPEDRITTRAMNITRRVKSTKSNLNQYLAELGEELPVINNKSPQVVKRYDRTPEQREQNRIEGEVRRNSRTAKGAKEVLDLKKGERNMNYNNLSQQQITDIARTAVEKEMEEDFNLGFLTNLTPKEKYARMEEFAKRLPTQYHNELFGFTAFFNAKKKELGHNKLIQLSRNLAQLAEHPEFRAIWNNEEAMADKNEIIRALGFFAKNKSGPK